MYSRYGYSRLSFRLSYSAMNSLICSVVRLSWSLVNLSSIAWQSLLNLFPMDLKFEDLSTSLKLLIRDKRRAFTEFMTTFGTFIESASNEELFKIAIRDELKIRGIFTRLFKWE